MYKLINQFVSVRKFNRVIAGGLGQVALQPGGQAAGIERGSEPGSGDVAQGNYNLLKFLNFFNIFN